MWGARSVFVYWRVQAVDITGSREKMTCDGLVLRVMKSMTVSEVFIWRTSSSKGFI